MKEAQIHRNLLFSGQHLGSCPTFQGLKYFFRSSFYHWLTRLGIKWAFLYLRALGGWCDRLVCYGVVFPNTLHYRQHPQPGINIQLFFLYPKASPQEYGKTSPYLCLLLTAQIIGHVHKIITCHHSCHCCVLTVCLPQLA